MEIQTRKLKGGVNLGIINTTKFKNNFFSLNFVLPLSDKNVSECNVLASVLMRGTQKHPTMQSVLRHVNMLYDTTVDIAASKTSCALIFRINAYFLDESYLPKGESADVFGEILKLMTEMLTTPVMENGALSKEYTESEKKRQIDKIKAKINNKDSFAFNRCNQIMLGDIPAALDALGTEEAVNGITPLSLYEKLQYILSKCYAEAVFAGNFTEKAEKTVSDMLSGLLGHRKESELVQVSEIIKPEFNGETKNVTEEIDAKQGRMVLGFSMPDTGDSIASVEVFNEIFGGSPVSRLFMNVRERLQLCYYCASVQNTYLNTMYVRSGINEDKRDIATKEILNQLENLKNPENISEYEMSSAKKSLLSSYKEVEDSIVRHAFWYIGMRVSGKKTDISKYVRDVEAVNAGDVSDIAKRVRFVISYFLRGKEE